MKGFMLGFFSVVMVGVLCSQRAVAEVESGLKVGEPSAAFNVRDVTGPSAGESLCYR